MANLVAAMFAFLLPSHAFAHKRNFVWQYGSVAAFRGERMSPSGLIAALTPNCVSSAVLNFERKEALQCIGAGLPSLNCWS